MSALKVLNKNFAALPTDAQRSINELIAIMLATPAATATIHRASKKGLENKPTLADDSEITPRRRGRPAKTEAVEVVSEKRGRGRPAKAATVEAAPAKRNGKASAKLAEVVKVTKPTKVAAPVTAKAAPPVNGVYDAIVLTAKGKEAKAEQLQAAIKKIEKFVNSDRTWHEALALATKKNVDVVFGRGKPSETGNKRKIAIAMINAGKL